MSLRATAGYIYNEETLNPCNTKGNGIGFKTMDYVQLMLTVSYIHDLDKFEHMIGLNRVSLKSYVMQWIVFDLIIVHVNV